MGQANKRTSTPDHQRPIPEGRPVGFLGGEKHAYSVVTAALSMTALIAADLRSNPTAVFEAPGLFFRKTHACAVLR